jgi:hypothetical protein
MGARSLRQRTHAATVPPWPAEDLLNSICRGGPRSKKCGSARFRGTVRPDDEVGDGTFLGDRQRLTQRSFSWRRTRSNTPPRGTRLRSVAAWTGPPSACGFGTAARASRPRITGGSSPASDGAEAPAARMGRVWSSPSLPPLPLRTGAESSLRAQPKGALSSRSSFRRAVGMARR